MASNSKHGLSYQVIDSVLTDDEIQLTLAQLQQYPSSTRRLLDNAYFQELVSKLTPRIPQVAGLTPVLATYFYKSPQNNWFVAAHQDLLVPVADHTIGNWKNATKKEQIPFTQAPKTVLKHCRNLRLQLDPATKGDICLLWGNKKIQPTVPVGGALAFTPLEIHSSPKLAVSSPPRRVVQILYGPTTLPKPYEWFQF